MKWSFAVGRTQELLYFMREIKDAGLVKSNPDFPVYIDSPLAKKTTTIFVGDLRGYLDEDAMELVQDGTHMFNFSNLRMTETSAESKELNLDKTPKVIISASGMCDAGRIRHHLKHNLWRDESTVVFVGFQGEGTLGRALLGAGRNLGVSGLRARCLDSGGHPHPESLSLHPQAQHQLSAGLSRPHRLRVPAGLCSHARGPCPQPPTPWPAPETWGPLRSGGLGQPGL